MDLPSWVVWVWFGATMLTGFLAYSRGRTDGRLAEELRWHRKRTAEQPHTREVKLPPMTPAPHAQRRPHITIVLTGREQDWAKTDKVKAIQEVQHRTCCALSDASLAVDNYLDGLGPDDTIRSPR